MPRKKRSFQKIASSQATQCIKYCFFIKTEIRKSTTLYPALYFSNGTRPTWDEGEEAKEKKRTQWFGYNSIQVY